MADGGLGEVKVTVRHPDGQSLFFTESIIQFLMNRRDKRRPFYLGHWLDSLDNADLRRLVDAGKQSRAYWLLRDVFRAPA
jgi:hypothetical protein